MINVRGLDDTDMYAIYSVADGCLSFSPSMLSRQTWGTGSSYSWPALEKVMWIDVSYAIDDPGRNRPRVVCVKFVCSFAYLTPPLRSRGCSEFAADFTIFYAERCEFRYLCVGERSGSLSRSFLLTAAFVETFLEDPLAISKQMSLFSIIEII